MVTAACFFFKEICNLNLEVFLIQLPNVFEKPQISNKWQNITTFVPKTCGLSNGVFTLPETETDTCCDIGQIDIFSRIELFPSIVLSSEKTNCKNDIQ